MSSKIFSQFINDMSGEYIDMVINDVQTISNLLYDERNKEQVIELYLNHEKSRRSKMATIKRLHKDIEEEQQLKMSLLNKPIEVLRQEGKLYKLLSNLKWEEVNWLKNKVDISLEFERLDKDRFEKEKRNRGTGVGISLNN